MNKTCSQAAERVKYSKIMASFPSSIVPATQSRQRQPSVVPPLAGYLVYLRGRCSLEGRNLVAAVSWTIHIPTLGKTTLPTTSGGGLKVRAYCVRLLVSSMEQLALPPLCRGHARRRKNHSGDASRVRKQTHAAFLLLSPSLPPSSQRPPGRSPALLPSE